MHFAILTKTLFLFLVPFSFIISWLVIKKFMYLVSSRPDHLPVHPFFLSNAFIFMRCLLGVCSCSYFSFWGFVSGFLFRKASEFRIMNTMKNDYNSDSLGITFD